MIASFGWVLPVQLMVVSNSLMSFCKPLGAMPLSAMCGYIFIRLLSVLAESYISVHEAG